MIKLLAKIVIIYKINKCLNKFKNKKKIINPKINLKIKYRI